MLRELLPADLIKLQSANDWKRSIVSVFNHDAGLSPEEAKIQFLKIVYRYILELPIILHIFDNKISNNLLHV